MDEQDKPGKDTSDEQTTSTTPNIDKYLMSRGIKEASPDDEVYKRGPSIVTLKHPSHYFLDTAHSTDPSPNTSAAAATPEQPQPPWTPTGQVDTWPQEQQDRTRQNLQALAQAHQDDPVNGLAKKYDELFPDSRTPPEQSSQEDD